MGVEISESPLKTFQLVNKKSGLVVAVKDASTVEGAELVQVLDEGALDQYWTGRVFNGEMLVGNAKSFLYASVQGASLEPGALLVQGQAASSAAKWRLEADGGAWRIKNVHSNCYMSVKDGSTVQCAPLVQQLYNKASEDQQWIRRLVKTIRVSVGATINGEPTVYCNPLVVRMPRGEKGILLCFVLESEFRSDWMFPTDKTDDSFYGIIIADGQGTEFVEPRRTGDHRVVVIDKNSDEFKTNYGYMVTLVHQKNNGRRISSDDPGIQNRSDG